MKTRFYRRDAAPGPPVAELELGAIPRPGDYVSLHGQTWVTADVIFHLDEGHIIVVLKTRAEYLEEMRSA